MEQNYNFISNPTFRLYTSIAGRFYRISFWSRKQLKKSAEIPQRPLLQISHFVSCSLKGSYDDRSISRWENGYCMPDLSLLQIISEELDVSVSELLNGRRMGKEGETRQNETVHMIIELSTREKILKAKKMNRYFSAAMCCFIVVILHLQFDILSFVIEENKVNLLTGVFTILGILLELTGFYHNTQTKMFTSKEFERLLKKSLLFS
ncbi:MAG: helix-turn-helix domain-containing protein [Lachnospiraceae bacterium]